MSNRIEEVVKESDKQQAATEAAALPEIKVGYVVAINEQGNFMFEVIGKSKGLVEVMGLHQYAAERIRLVMDGSTGAGDRLVQQVGALVLELNNKVDKLLQASAPQNKL